MRVGTLAYPTDSGLGLLAYDFHRHGVITDVFVVEHAHFPNHHGRYPSAPRVPIRLLQKSEVLLRDWLGQLDVALFLETPFLWDLVDWCRQAGVRVALLPMYECMPEVLPAAPDLLLCPSLLDLEYYAAGYDRQRGAAGEPGRWWEGKPGKGSSAVYLPVPVDTPWRRRDKVRMYVHNAGHLGLKGRNGTAELVDALKFVRQPINLLLRSQVKLPWGLPKSKAQVELCLNTLPREDLYALGDAFVFPEKFNGLSLPLQEARASGMLVLGSDRFPMNTWLPRAPLITVAGMRRERISGRCNEFDAAVITPEAVAYQLDEWWGREITEYSLAGQRWAEANGWAVLGPLYRQALERLVG